MKITYIGHAAFAVEIEDKRFLFDPWLNGNPMAAWDLERAISWKPDFVFVSHGHRDHGFEEAVEITKRTEAKAVGVFELINALERKGGKGVSANIGGRFRVDGIEIYLTPALHTCPYGNPTGFIVSYKGKTLYHAGDTGIFSEMALLGKLFSIDVAFLPVGGYFTMGIKELPLAKDMLKAKNVIAMHFDTFPAIKVDHEEVKRQAILLAPGESIEL